MRLDIRKLEKKVSGKRSGTFAPMYVYGTEMIANYYSRIDLRGKRVLTIAGSGDQVISAYAMGARDVVGFDLNRLVPLFNELKFAAIQSLSYQEFLRFFGPGTRFGRFEYKLYLRCHPRLSATARRFFDALYRYFHRDGRRMARSPLFHQRLFIKQRIGRINGYLQDENAYLKTREVLSRRKSEVVVGDVLTIANHPLIQGRFDVINLSNVPNFVTYFYRKEKDPDPVMRFYKTVLLKLKRRLTPNGMIIFYAYSPSLYPNEVAKRPPPIQTPEQLNRFKRRREFRYRELKFKGIFGGYDKTIILQNR